MKHGCTCLLLLYMGACFIPYRAIAQEDGQDIQELSLDSLLNTEISTAAKYKQTISEAPASVTIITAEDIKRYGYQTLEEVFRSIRGFYVSNDRNYSYLGARGFGRPTDYNSRILLLINGHSTNENVYGGAYIGTEGGLNLDIIERIEIVRGPGSALYGNSAMFAVINIITKKGNMIDGLKLSAETGSYGKLQAAAAFGKEFNNGINLLISSLGADIKGQDLYYQEYDDPSTNHGIAENLDWDQYYGLLTTLTYDDFTLQGILTSRKKGIPTGSFEVAFNDDSSQTLDELKWIELKYDRNISAEKHLMLRGYFDGYRYWGAYPYDVPSWDASDGNWLGSEIQFLWDVRVNNRMTVGAEYKKNFRADYRYWDANTTYFNENFPFNVFSFYLQDEYQVRADLSLIAGIRRDEYSTVGSSTTPRAAIVYNPMKSGTLKLLYGEAFRAPNVYEVHYETVLAGAKGNPALKPEKIRTAEVLWEQRLSDELFGIVSLYRYEIKNLISQTVDSADSLQQFQNMSQVKASGLEVELNARLKMGLGGYGSYVFQNAEDADLNEKLTNSPSHLLKIGLTYPVMKHFYAAAELQYETERISVYGTKTDSYLLTNLNLSTKPLFQHIHFSFLVNNLFNITYKTPGGLEHKQPAIIQNGRNFATTLEYQF